MKKYIFLSIMAAMSFVSLNGQVYSNQNITNSIPTENAFLDASSTFSTEFNGVSNNTGKGLVFPTVDLVNFEFKISNMDGWSIFPTFFNGMVVYNRVTGTTLTSGNRSSKATVVTPGFYYYHNPTGRTLFDTYYDVAQAVKAGEWRPLGSGADVVLPGTWIYCPPFMLPWTANATNKTVNLYNQYTDGVSAYTTSSNIKKTTSPTQVSNFVGAATEFDYMVRYSGASITIISIAPNGDMVYDCTAIPPTYTDFVSVILIKK